jgi:hypothetical protein
VYEQKDIDWHKRMTAIKKHQRALKDLRANAQVQLKNKKPEQVLHWTSQQFLALFRSLVDEAAGVLRPAAPCPWAALALGPLARGEFTPSGQVEFALLAEQTPFAHLEYFRCLVQLIDLKMINLQETEYAVLNSRTRSLLRRGFSLDYARSVPFRQGQQGLLQLVGTPVGLASLQEGESFAVHAPLSLGLWAGSLLTGEKRLWEEFRSETCRVLQRRFDVSPRKLCQERGNN